MVRKAFEGYDEPVNIDLDPEEALKIVLQVEPCENDLDAALPVEGL
jgi:hypothetical protein